MQREGIAGRHLHKADWWECAGGRKPKGALDGSVGRGEPSLLFQQGMRMEGSELKAAEKELSEMRYWLLLISLIGIAVVIVGLKMREDDCTSSCKQHARETLREMGIAPVKANETVFNAQVEFCMPICKRQQEAAKALKANGGDEPL
jgi:hypothetical protein